MGLDVLVGKNSLDTCQIVGKSSAASLIVDNTDKLSALLVDDLVETVNDASNSRLEGLPCIANAYCNLFLDVMFEGKNLKGSQLTLMFIS